jgi:hypothetical protein
MYVQIRIQLFLICIIYGYGIGMMRYDDELLHSLSGSHHIHVS